MVMSAYFRSLSGSFQTDPPGLAHPVLIELADQHIPPGEEISSRSPGQNSLSFPSGKRTSTTTYTFPRSSPQPRCTELFTCPLPLHFRQVWSQSAQRIAWVTPISPWRCTPTLTSCPTRRPKLSRHPLARPAGHLRYPAPEARRPRETRPAPPWTRLDNHDPRPLLALDTQYGKACGGRNGRSVGLGDLLLPFAPLGRWIGAQFQREAVRPHRLPHHVFLASSLLR